MDRASLVWTVALIGATTLGCKEVDDGFAFSAEATGTSAVEPEETEESGESETTGPPEPEVYEGLRFIASGSDPAVILALDLDTPHSIPEAETIITGEGQAGLFGRTPWGSHIVTHQGQIEQLRLSGFGEFSLESVSTVEGNWLKGIWFDEAGTSAVVSLAETADALPQGLLLLSFNDGVLAGTLDFSPQLEESGAAVVIDRSPDGEHLAILIDAEMDGLWQLWHAGLNPDPDLFSLELVDQAMLAGIPAQNVQAVLWAHIDDQRIVYRKELLPNMLRPVAVPVDDPSANPVNLAPTLGHVSSMVFNDSNTAMLVGTEGGEGYRVLDYIHLDGPTEAREPITMTEPDALALNVVLPPLGEQVQGHGFDAMDRIFYGYSATNQKTDGVGLVTHFEGGIVDRTELATLPPDGRVEALHFDPLTQLLAYRVVTAGSSWIAYVDLGQEVPVEIRLDQFYDHDELMPEDFAGFGWSADKTTIVTAGTQGGIETVHVAVVGDILGETLALPAPEVEETEGVNLEHTPIVTPDGLQTLLWYSTVNNRRGLVQIPTDGEGQATPVVNLQYSLNEGAFMP